MTPIQTLLLILAAAGLFATLWPPSGVEVSYDRQVNGHKLVLSLESRWGDLKLQGDFGARLTDGGEVRPDLSFQVDLTPRPPSPFRLETLPQIRFEITSPEGLLVAKGQEVRLGDLLAVRDPEEYRRIQEALAQARAQEDGDLIPELERRLREQEVRSLLEGVIVHLGLVQEDSHLAVVLYIGEGERP
jgi:hypothetical protein